MKWLSKQRRVRILALAEKLSNSEYDLVCLQELWVFDDFLLLQAKLRHILPYSHYYFAGFLGSRSFVGDPVDDAIRTARNS